MAWKVNFARSIGHLVHDRQTAVRLQEDHAESISCEMTAIWRHYKRCGKSRRSSGRPKDLEAHAALAQERTRPRYVIVEGTTKSQRHVPGHHVLLLAADISHLPLVTLHSPNLLEDLNHDSSSNPSPGHRFLKRLVIMPGTCSCKKQKEIAAHPRIHQVAAQPVVLQAAVLLQVS